MELVVVVVLQKQSQKSATEKRIDGIGFKRAVAVANQNFPAADSRLRRIGVLREIPVGIVDLQQVMPDVPDEGGALALALELEEYVSG